MGTDDGSASLWTLDANNAGFAGDVKDPGILDRSRTCHTGMLYIGTHLDPP